MHFLSFLLLLQGWAEATTQTPEPTKPLTVIISDFTDTQAIIKVGLYDSSTDFPKPRNGKGSRGYVIKPNGKTTVTLTITDAPYGEYAVALYQDVNGNGNFDRGGLMGLPREPYSFSNNFRPMQRLRGPRFTDCRFVYSATQREVRVQMLNN